ncbi:MAG: esterase/lipase family protein [Candidatus Hodarchaeales archaeon]
MEKKINNFNIAVLVHGFIGKKEFMNEIQASLTKKFSKIYTKVLNLSYYNSSYGVDISQAFDIITPIYSPDSEQTLSHFLLRQLESLLEDYSSPVTVDFYAHSMGGLVVRAMIRYLFSYKSQRFNVNRIILLGTPNHGTRLAQGFINVPTDILLTGLNLALEIPRGGITREDWNILKSQFIQMIPGSKFLYDLNKPLLKHELDINWITVRGLNSSGLLESVWQPFLFRKFWLSRKFPFIHKGVIPNDGIVDAESVPLRYAENFTIPEAKHMDLVKWETKPAGKKVSEILSSIILKNS